VAGFAEDSARPAVAIDPPLHRLGFPAVLVTLGLVVIAGAGLSSQFVSQTSISLRDSGGLLGPGRLQPNQGLNSSRS